MNKHYIEEKVYSCAHCGNATYAEIDSVLKHKDKCLKNVDNKNCFTCKHFKVRVEPNTYSNDYYSEVLYKELGYSYSNKGLCGKNIDKELDEIDLIELNKDCWEHYDGKHIETFKSERYLFSEEMFECMSFEEENLREFDKDRLKLANELKSMREKKRPQKDIDKYYKVESLKLINKYDKITLNEDNKRKAVLEKYKYIINNDTVN